jgi:hypothetical protein
MSLTDAATELNQARWQKTTDEQRKAHGRRMRLGLIVKELTRPDWDPDIREIVVGVIVGRVGELTSDQQNRLLNALMDQDGAQ